MSDPKKHHALFFTERGAGPDDVSLWTQPLDAIVDKGESIAPRTLGLRIRPRDEFPLVFARAGGYQMDEATVRALHAEFGAWLDATRTVAPDSIDEDRAARREVVLAKLRALPPDEQRQRLRNLVDAITPDLLLDADEDGASLAVDDVSDGAGRHILVDIGDVDSSRSTRLDEERVRKLVAWGQAWLDAPRDAARTSAESVREVDGVVLLRTSTGEWGVREIIEPDPDTGEEEPQPPPDWHASEAEARHDFAHRTGNEICECCSAFVPEHEAVATMDDVHLCPTCAAGLRAEDDAKPYHCVGSSRGGDPEPPCGWTGTGAEMTHAGLCPKCDGDAEIIEPTAPEAGEAPRP